MQKTREYNLTYAFLIHIVGGEDATMVKDNIEHIKKLPKVHRLVIDADYGFISST